MIGIIGSQAEALEIMGQIRTFLERTLHLKVSETKSQTLHIREGFRYLVLQREFTPTG